MGNALDAAGGAHQDEEGDEIDHAGDDAGSEGSHTSDEYAADESHVAPAQKLSVLRVLRGRETAWQLSRSAAVCSRDDIFGLPAVLKPATTSDGAPAVHVSISRAVARLRLCVASLCIPVRLTYAATALPPDLLPLLDSLRRRLGDADDADLAASARSFHHCGGLDLVFTALAALHSHMVQSCDDGGAPTLLQKRLMRAAEGLLYILREALYTLNEGDGAGDAPWFASDAGVARCLEWFKFPDTVQAACLAAEEVVSCATALPTLRGIARNGVNLVHILTTLCPKDFIMASRVLAMLTFDPVAQDPQTPLKPHAILARARATATYFAERLALEVHVDQVGEATPVARRVSVALALRDALPLRTQMDACTYVSRLESTHLHAVPSPCALPWTIAVTPAVDENHYMLLQAGDGLLIYRLLQLLALPRAAEGAMEAVTLLEQLRASQAMVNIPLELLVSVMGAQLPASAAELRVAVEAIIQFERQPVMPSAAMLARMMTLARKSPQADLPAPPRGEQSWVDITDPVLRAHIDLHAIQSGQPWLPAPHRIPAPLVQQPAAVSRAWEHLYASHESHSRDMASLHTGRVPSKFAWPFIDVSRATYDRYANSARAVFTSHPVLASNGAVGSDDADAASEASSGDVVHEAAKEVTTASGVLGDIFTSRDVQPPVRPASQVRVRFGSRSRRAREEDAAAATASVASARSRIFASADSLLAAALRVTADAARSTVLSVMSSFLAGPRRRQLQDFVAATGGLRALTRHALAADWLFDPGDSPYPRIHGPTCTCRPETEETIQLLRLLYCLHDRECSCSVQRWLPRRRLMTQKELLVAFTHYAHDDDTRSHDTAAQAWSAAHAALEEEGSKLEALDESALLITNVRSSACRPHAWLRTHASPTAGDVVTVRSIASERSAAAAIAWIGVPSATETPPVVTASSAAAPLHHALHVYDTVLAGSNAIGATVDSAATPEEALLIDGPCDAAHVPAGMRQLLTTAIRTGACSTDIFELQERPRGLLSMMLCALVLSKKSAPYRTWLSTNIDCFLRAAPVPVRRWVAAHGLVAYLVRALLDEHALERLAPRAAGGVSGSRAGAAGVEANASAKRRARYFERRTAGDSDAEPLQSPPMSDAEDDGASNDEDEEHADQRYAVESMFDLLGELVRLNRSALDSVATVEAEWAAALPAAHASVLVACGSDAGTGVGPLMLLVLDRLQDSVMFIRNLLVTEDWAYGLCDVAHAVAGVDLPKGVPSLPYADVAGAWPSLARASLPTAVSDADAPVWYTCVDEHLLASPFMVFLRLHRVPLLHAMLMTVSLKRLSQDTVCVVTTSLLMFVLAHRHGALPALVRALVAYDRTRMEAEATQLASSALLLLPAAPLPRPPLPTLPPVDAGPDLCARKQPALIYDAAGTSRVAHRFASLACFWLEYYSLRVRDRAALRSSTGYTYDEFRVVTLALLGRDESTPSPPFRAHMEYGRRHPMSCVAGDEGDPHASEDAASPLEPPLLAAWRLPPPPHSLATYWRACNMLTM